MGCTLHQHGHSHGGGGGHGHGHGHGHSHGASKPSNSRANIAFRSSGEDLETAGAESSSEESCASNGQPHPKQNINVRAAYIHVIGDFLQSVGVFAAALVIYFEVSMLKTT